MKMNKKMLTVMVMAMMLVLVFAGCHNIVEPDSRGLVFTLSEDGTYYSLTDLGGNKDAEITVPAEHEGKPVKEIAGFVFSNNDVVTKVIVSEGIEVIGGNAFDSCDSLKEIVLPVSLKTIGMEAFSRCSSLESISIPKNVTSIGTAPFRGCFSLMTIDVVAENTAYKSTEGSLLSKDGKVFISYAFGRKFVDGYEFPALEGVEVIAEYAFIGCDFENITIPATVKTIAKGAFAFNRWATTINFVGDMNTWVNVERYFETTETWDYSMPTTIVACTDYCVSISKVMESLKDENGEVVKDDNGKVVEILVEKFEVVGEELEYNDNGDGTCVVVSAGEFDSKELVVPCVYNGLKVKGIGEAAFEGNDKITSVRILNGVESIGNRAFADCKALASVRFLATVSVIGDEAFADCAKLATIIYFGNVEAWNAVVKGENWADGISATVVRCTKSGDINIA